MRTINNHKAGSFKKDEKTGKRRREYLRARDTLKDRRKETAELADLDEGLITTYHKREYKKLSKKGLEQGEGIYDDFRFPHIAEVLCKEYGLIAAQLAEVFGVALHTINHWMIVHPKFRDAVRKGRDSFDTEKVEKSLLKRALGYKYEEKTIKNVYLIGKDKFTDVEVAVPAKETIVTQKELPPDVKACQFWLQNRNSDRWKAVSYINAQIAQNKTVTNVNVDADLENMSPAQIKALRDLIEASNATLEHKDGDSSISDDEMMTMIGKTQKLLGNNSDIEDYEL